MKLWRMVGVLTALVALAQVPPPGATQVRAPLDELQFQEAQLTMLKDDMRAKTIAAQSATIAYMQGEQMYRAAYEKAVLDCKGSLSVVSSVWRCVPKPLESKKADKPEKKSE